MVDGKQDTAGADGESFELFVNGTLMRGLALHGNLEGATFLREAETAPKYHVYSVDDRHPAMFEVEEGGVAVPGELYQVPRPVWERVKAEEPPNLYLGPVELSDGRQVPGILYPQALAEGVHRNISNWGGWRAYTAAQEQPLGREATQ